MSDDSGMEDACWEFVLDAGRIPHARAIAVRVSGLPLVIVRSGADLWALSGVCPHDHASLDGGEIHGRTLVCPRHQARFDVESGACVGGFTLPALGRYPVRVRDGRVEVDGAAVRRDPPLAGPRERWDLTRPR